MSWLDEKCAICKKPYGKHRASDAPLDERLACPFYIDDNPDLFAGWHPSNRFTPAVRARVSNCPVCNGRIPYKCKCTPPFPWATGKEALQAGRMANPNLATAETSIPPGCAPFDLAKALAGAELVTRGRGPARYFRVDDPRSGFDRYRFTHGPTELWAVCDRNGKHKTDPSLDLFLAAKEEPEAVMERLRAKVKPRLDALKASEGALVSPPPETEARRAESEKVLAYESLLQEALPSLWNHDALLYDKIKSALESSPASPAPPRRVWLSFDAGPEPVVVKPSQSLLKAAEYINLNQLLAIAPEIRVKLGMGGERV